MSIKLKINSSDTIIFDLNAKDILTPYAGAPVSSVAKLNNLTTQAQLCTSTNCYNCTEVHCTEIQCNNVQCTSVMVQCKNCNHCDCACDCSYEANCDCYEGKDD